jgi:hypothetical protein
VPVISREEDPIDKLTVPLNISVGMKDMLGVMQ